MKKVYTFRSSCIPLQWVKYLFFPPRVVNCSKRSRTSGLQVQSSHNHCLNIIHWRKELEGNELAIRNAFWCLSFMKRNFLLLYFIGVLGSLDELQFFRQPFLLEKQRASHSRVIYQVVLKFFLCRTSYWVAMICGLAFTTNVAVISPKSFFSLQKSL